MFHLNQAKVDSLRIFIPLDKVTIYNPKLNQQFVRYFQDIDEFDDVVEDPKPISMRENGITQGFYIKGIITGADKEQHKYLFIKLNAKMLKSKYFEGITADNIDDIYSYLIECNHVYFSFEDFLQSYITDVDICYDVKVDNSDLKPIVSSIKQKVRYPNYLSHKSSGTGTTLKFNTRENAKPTKPHIQIYDKTAELEFNSYEFKNKYLKDIEIPLSILRLEFTIKNSKHKKSLNIEAKTLSGLLLTLQDDLKKVVLSGLPKYTYKRKRQMKKDVGINDYILLQAFDVLITENKMGLESAIALADGITDKSKRSKCKKKIEDVYLSADHHNQKLQNSRVDDYLKEVDLL